jgi:predicted PurR-regulated permease PerM
MIVLAAAALVAVGVLLDWYLYRHSSYRAARVPWRKWLTVGPAIGLGLYFFWSVRSIVMPFLVAFFLAALLDPVVLGIERKGVSRARAVASLFGLILCAIVLAGLLIVPAALRQVGQFASGIGNDVQKLTARAQGVTKSADAWFVKNRESLAAVGIKDPPSKILSDKSGPLAGAAANVLSSVRDSILGMLGQVLWLIIVPLSLLYFLMEYPVIRAKLVSFVPNEHRAEVNRMSGEVVEIFATYILGLAKVCILYGVVATCYLFVFHVSYSLFLGIAAGALYAVPYVGPIVAIGSAGVLTFAGSGSVGLSLLVMAGMLVLQFSFDYVVTPRIVGGSVGLHPLVNIFALMCGATLFGVWGMLLAVPVAASVQMLLCYFIPALGEKPAADPASKRDASRLQTS